jgi:hypothetical protein
MQSDSNMEPLNRNVTERLQSKGKAVPQHIYTGAGREKV